MAVRKCQWFVAACAVLCSSAVQAHSYARCSQRAFDQRLTGLEPGVWISDGATVTGLVFFLADSARSKSFGDGVLKATFLALAPAGLYLTFLGPTGGGGCVVRPHDEVAQGSVIAPFRDREEARQGRAEQIRMQQVVLGSNLLASTAMFFLVQDRGSRIALGAAAAFPALYSLVRWRKFSPERDEDAALPARADLHLAPVMSGGPGRGGPGLIASWIGTF
jgi:hypothetical protein